MKVYDYFNNRFFYKGPAGETYAEPPMRKNRFYKVSGEQESKLKEITFYASLPAFAVYAIVAGVLGTLMTLDITLLHGFLFCLLILVLTWYSLGRFYKTLGEPLNDIDKSELVKKPSTLYERLFYISLTITIFALGYFLIVVNSL